MNHKLDSFFLCFDAIKYRKHYLSLQMDYLRAQKRK